MREHGARWQDLNADDQIRFSSRQDLGRVGTGSIRMAIARTSTPGLWPDMGVSVASRVDKGWGIPADQYQPDQAFGMGASWQPEHG